MKRRVATTLIVWILLALPAVAQERRVVVSVEEYLPPDSIAFVSVPDLMTANEILERAGEGREALARRLTTGTKLDAGQVSILFEILAAAADAQTTFSLHPGILGAKPDFLVTASTARKGDHLEKAIEDLMRGFLIPFCEGKVREEQLAGHDLFHLKSGETDIYLIVTRGFVLASSSPLLLGRVLREMQSPTGKTLAHFARFAATRREAKALAGGEHGFFYFADPSLLPFEKQLNLRNATGIITLAEGGFREVATLRAGPGGLLSELTAGRVSTSWSDRGRDRAWLTASMSPAGVMRLSQAVLGGPLSPLAAWIQDVAAGPVELLLRPGAVPVLRIRLVDGVTDQALRPLKGISRREGDALLISAEPKSMEGLTVGESAWLKEPGQPVSARIKTRIAELFGMLGADGEGATGATVWQVRVTDSSDAGVSVRVTSGLAEAGPFSIALASLLR